MPRYYQSAFNPPDQMPAGSLPPARHGWEAVTPRADRRVPARQQTGGDQTAFPPRPVPQGWEAVVGQPRRATTRQQPAPDQPVVRIVSAQPPGREGWAATVPAADRRGDPRQQPGLDPTAFPYQAAPQPAEQAGWVGDCGQPRRSAPRQQPQQDAAFRPPAAATVAAPQGWEATSGRPSFVARRQVAGEIAVASTPPATGGGTELFWIGM